MKQEQKDLLLKDLCARLPYGVVIQEKCVEQDETFLPNTAGDRLVNIDANADLLMTNCGSWYYLDEIKPYLFPMSSITEEQKESCCVEKSIIDAFITGSISLFEDESLSVIDILNLLDWLNRNHFDYRDLIEKGLAIDATNLNVY